MNVDKLNDWLQLIAAIGVLIGLLLVAYELRQEHELVRAQLVSETFAATQELRSSFQNPNVTRACVTAYTSPETLTIEEQVILDEYFANVIAVVVGRNMAMVDQGLFDAVYMDNNARIAARVIFASDYGREWWAVRREKYVSVLRDFIDEAAKNDSGGSPFEDAALVLERVKQISRKPQ